MVGSRAPARASHDAARSRATVSTTRATTPPSSIGRLFPVQLRDLGVAADALCQREGHLAGIVVNQELDRYAASVEPDRISGAAIDLVFDGGNSGAIDLHLGLLAGT